jgi:hypothetical protein
MGRELAVSYLLQHLALLLGRQRPPLFRSSFDLPLCFSRFPE